MKCLRCSLFYLFILVCGITYAQQISVDDTKTPQQLIQDHLVSGCVESNNVSSPINGSLNNLISYGYFEKQNSNFPFENGIVISSGEVNRIGNGEDNGIITSGNFQWGTDPAIEDALGIGNTLNATTIQFEFSSISDRIEFNYILASEEYYANFPCSFSDGFAFLIRKAGTQDSYENIALVPGSSTPVNTTTIRPEITGFCDAQNEEYFAGFSMGDTNFNGRTEVLTAVANIEPYEVYEIKLVVADQNDTNYDTAVFIEGNSFGSTIDLGEDFQTCASQVLLNGDINNPSAIYSWFLNGELIADANTPTLSATESGNYRVEASIALNNSDCILTDDINLTIDTAQSADPVSDFVLCDTNNNGIQNFDLSTKTQEVLESVMASTYDISFHVNLDDAQQNTNAINGSINNSSNPQTVHTRIEDLNSGCIIYSTFNLVVSELPAIANPTPLILCAPVEQNGQIAIDLSQKDEEITNGNPDLSVSYHSNSDDAQSGSNALILPYVNSNENETIFISVIDSTTGCISTTTLELSVIDEPEINSEEPLYLDACDEDHDGNASFDLTTIIPLAIEDVEGYLISFHETIEDAEAGINAVENTTNYSNIEENVQTIFIRVQASTSDCYSVAPVELHTNLLLTGTNIRDFSACDEDGDGVEGFYFDSIATSIINGIPNLAVTFHLTEEERDNEVNAIDADLVFYNTSNPQTIYINLYSPTCHDVAQFNLIVNQIVEFETVDTLYVCDEDQDGLTTVDLESFDEAVTFGQEGFSVVYFASEEDAESNSNPLPRFYENTTSPFTLYPRIIADDTGCGSTNAFQVIIRLAPVTNTPEGIVICDMDLDGFHLLNLNDVIPEVVSSTSNRLISFHTNASDAEIGNNSIINTEAYNAQTEEIFIRVENTDTGCHSIEVLDVIVNTFPIIGDNGLINQYLICENSSDGIADFIFATRDDEIIGNQLGKETSYYLSQNDADNRENAIDKNAPFSNISNPQTIYVRLENTSDMSCYDTGSFEIYVSTNPEFNIPTDIIICDDISNNGTEIIDFQSKITEIIEGHPDIQLVTFHVTEDDAINGLNPLQEGYSSEVNPQEIFARIDNGTECQSITSFVFTVIQAPSVSLPAPLSACDNNFDGYEIFDLTESEFDIFDIRQDDIEVSYHVTYNDADQGINVITNPENHNHDTSSEGVYIRVTNTISNCYVILPLEIEINLPPQFNNFGRYEVCPNGEGTVDLNEVTALAIENTEGILISYHNTADEALNNINPLDLIYTYSHNTEDIFIRAENQNSSCVNTYRFQLKVFSQPFANAVGPIEYCDDNLDGQLEVDLSEKYGAILGTQNPDRIVISYHINETDALSGANPLPDLYFATDGDVIYTRAENILTGCFGTSQFDIFINPLPTLNIGDQVVCIDNLPLLVDANTGIETDTYLWSTGETSSSIEITTIGDYWVTVTTKDGCETSENFNVSESESATIEFTEVLDFSDPNNITITVSGIGDYLYILDDGEPQESNVFEHVSLGYHIITIIDLNGCAPITKEVLVIDAPKFFTPNNDGQFDTWHITGVETLPGTEIFIYDRYGRLLKKLSWNTPGWDGLFNGDKLRADDYWFKAFVKRGQIAFEVNGHFALRR